MYLTDLYYDPTRHAQCFAATNRAVEYAGGCSAIEEAIDELINVFAIDAQVIGDTGFIFIALNVEQADFCCVQGNFPPTSLLCSLQFIVLEIGVKIVPTLESAIFCQGVQRVDGGLVY